FVVNTGSTTCMVLGGPLRVATNPDWPECSGVSRFCATAQSSAGNALVRGRRSIHKRRRSGGNLTRQPWGTPSNSDRDIRPVLHFVDDGWSNVFCVVGVAKPDRVIYATSF